MTDANGIEIKVNDYIANTNAKELIAYKVEGFLRSAGRITLYGVVATVRWCDVKIVTPENDPKYFI